MIHVPNGMGLRFVAILVLAAGLAHPAEPQEWARPYPTHLPGFEPVDAAGKRTCVSVRLLHQTDKGLVAVTGGRVSFWTEDGDLSTLASSLLAEAASDEFGFANLPRPRDVTSGDHWIFTAPGLGASHEFAAFDGFDDSEVVLPGGVDRRIRVSDPLGAPLAGADVSMYLGCPHSPSVCTGTTGEDGVVLLDDLIEGRTLCDLADVHRRISGPSAERRGERRPRHSDIESEGHAPPPCSSPAAMISRCRRTFVSIDSRHSGGACSTW